MASKKPAAARAAGVKNKAAASIQITAEQILREAHDIQESQVKPPKQRITDPQELAEHRARKRKEFEDRIRMQRMNPAVWMKYAAWEISQNDIRRARSIYERFIDVDYRYPAVWLKYAEMEMKHKNINSARNVWDRAVVLLPRIDQFWYKYIYMEDMLGNYAGVRQIFERWMEWEPDDNAWNSYIKFEVRHKEFERARMIYRRFVQVHPTVQTWTRWAKFEEKIGDIEMARQVYQNAIDYLGEEANDQELFIAFAQLEINNNEFERARAIYKYALDHIPKGSAEKLYKLFISFEKQHGSKTDIETVIVSKRRFQYEEELKLNPRNYDIWFDYIRLEESVGEYDRIRDVYERAIAQLPPAPEKRFWRRYIYLWINYALFEELEAKDMDRTRAIYNELLRQIPHKSFSFSKIWIMFCQFEIRRLNLDAARKIMGRAIAFSPKDRIFKAYIDLEFKLGNIDRCRKVYEKWLELSPNNCNAWCGFADLEKSLAEFERVRAIYNIAIDQPSLDMPELVWKAYIDFEIEQGEVEKTRSLYRMLLDRTQHVKVWISFAKYEYSVGNVDAARKIFLQAYSELKREGLREERVLLVESFKEFEEEVGDAKYLEELKKYLPERVKKRRQLFTEEGAAAGWEEYFDYIFPDEEEEKQPSLKLLAAAQQWKKQQQEV